MCRVVVQAPSKEEDGTDAPLDGLWPVHRKVDEAGAVARNIEHSNGAL